MAQGKKILFKKNLFTLPIPIRTNFPKQTNLKSTSLESPYQRNSVVVERTLPRAQAQPKSYILTTQINSLAQQWTKEIRMKWLSMMMTVPHAQKISMSWSLNNHYKCNRCQRTAGGVSSFKRISKMPRWSQHSPSLCQEGLKNGYMLKGTQVSYYWRRRYQLFKMKVEIKTRRQRTRLSQPGIFKLFKSRTELWTNISRKETPQLLKISWTKALLQDRRIAKTTKIQILRFTNKIN
jgi:hypothetical protein